MSLAWLSSCQPSFSPSCPPLSIQLLQRGKLGTMSLLNPVLQPPKVKAYLSQGERFIKWDDVSGAGATGCWGTGVAGVGMLGALLGWMRWFMSARAQVLMRLGQAADIAAWINQPGGGVCAPSIQSLGYGSVSGCEMKVGCLEVGSHKRKFLWVCPPHKPLRRAGLVAPGPGLCGKKVCPGAEAGPEAQMSQAPTPSTDTTLLPL